MLTFFGSEKQTVFVPLRNCTTMTPRRALTCYQTKCIMSRNFTKIEELQVVKQKMLKTKKKKKFFDGTSDFKFIFFLSLGHEHFWTFLFKHSLKLMWVFLVQSHSQSSVLCQMGYFHIAVFALHIEWMNVWKSMYSTASWYF